jgi:tRNA modification GTPase
MIQSSNEPIVALSTPVGRGALAVIRLSGRDTIKLVNQIFHGKDLTQQPSHSLHVGTLIHEEKVLDEVLVALFRTPTSFTKEESIEISCHGSMYIAQNIIQTLITLGARLATPGEFTQRAFLNGRFDLVQAEAVADLIAADTALAHKTALQQMRSGFSSELQILREKLIQLGALLELELDFAEEDVAFLDRQSLIALVQSLRTKIGTLIQSFEKGNVIKNGLPIVIVGKPNVGKSTLLNALIQEERAIVSSLPGTTRDLIEVEKNIGGICCRFIDTAGLRDHTNDEIELIGIAKAREKMQRVALILYIFDLQHESLSSIQNTLDELATLDVPCIAIGNKLDVAPVELVAALTKKDFILIAAAQHRHIDHIEKRIIQLFGLNDFETPNPIVVNVRHYESLVKADKALLDVLSGVAQQLSTEWLMLDIKHALNYLGEITGQITTDNILDEIFSKFCIGK